MSKYLSHHLGWRAILVTGWLGVPIHEISHLIFARLFQHRIVAWKLFDPDPVSGTLGYVRHAYSRRSPWQIIGTFFIGLSPVILGSLLITSLLWWVMPGKWPGILFQQLLVLKSPPQVWSSVLPSLFESSIQLSKAVWQQRTWLLPLQIYLGICVANHMAPSRADLKGALPGLALLTVFIGIIVCIASWYGVSFLKATTILVPFILLYIGVSFFQGIFLLSLSLIRFIPIFSKR